MACCKVAVDACFLSYRICCAVRARVPAHPFFSTDGLSVPDRLRVTGDQSAEGRLFVGHYSGPYSPPSSPC